MIVFSTIIRFIIVGFVLWCGVAIVLRMFDTDNVAAMIGIGIAWLLAGWDAWQHFQKHRLPVQGHICRHCGYDLRASRERCPECGTDIPGTSS